MPKKPVQSELELIKFLQDSPPETSATELLKKIEAKRAAPQQPDGGEKKPLSCGAAADRIAKQAGFKLRKAQERVVAAQSAPDLAQKEFDEAERLKEQAAETAEQAERTKKE